MSFIPKYWYSSRFIYDWIYYKKVVSGYDIALKVKRIDVSFDIDQRSEEYF